MTADHVFEGDPLACSSCSEYDGDDGTRVATPAGPLCPTCAAEYADAHGLEL